MSNGEFSLSIKLGNAAMQSPSDIAQELRKFADYLEASSVQGEDNAGRIFDVNGNSIGEWDLAYEPDEESVWYRIGEDVRRNISTMSRPDCVRLLESHGIQCYDHEDVHVLRRAIAVNVDDGTIDRDLTVIEE